MAKVLFLNPVIRQEAKPTHIPYGFAQLIALAVKAGHQVQLFDANAWRPTEKEIREVINADNWDVIATGGLVTTYGFIKKAVRCARQVNKKALIILGGGVITPIPYEVMRFLPEVDIGIIGEGYQSLIEILKNVDVGYKEWEGIKGIIFRRGKELQLNTERPLLEDLDSLPFPAWELFPLQIYFRNSPVLLSEEAMLAKRRIDVLASYGCPFRCKYCFHLGLSGEIKIINEGKNKRVVPTSHRRVRFHSPEYVVEMVKYAKKKFKIDFVSFLDENFTNLARNDRWFDDFAWRWEKAGLSAYCSKKQIRHNPKECKGIHWGTTAHAAIVNKDMLQRFRKLGCSFLDYGLESFSDKVLISIGKGSNAKLNKRALEMTLRAGIRPIPNQIIGFPQESFESIKLSVIAWQELGIKAIPFFATPYPGSEWFYQYRERILNQYGGNLEKFLLDLGDATRLTAVISNNFNAVELLGLRELMVNHDLKRIEEYENMRLGVKEGCCA